MAWKKTKWQNYKTFPEISCVYVFYINDEVVYIGSTVNLRARMSAYKFLKVDGFLKTPWRKKVDLDSKVELKYKGSKKYAYWLMLEARLIKRLQPKYNIKLKCGTHHG